VCNYNAQSHIKNRQEFAKHWQPFQFLAFADYTLHLFLALKFGILENEHF
jgi:hypothetical protein